MIEYRFLFSIYKIVERRNIKLFARKKATLSEGIFNNNIGL
jgi:hypothetical protein